MYLKHGEAPHKADTAESERQSKLVRSAQDRRQADEESKDEEKNREQQSHYEALIPSQSTTENANLAVGVRGRRAIKPLTKLDSGRE